MRRDFGAEFAQGMRRRRNKAMQARRCGNEYLRGLSMLRRLWARLKPCPVTGPFLHRVFHSLRGPGLFAVPFQIRSFATGCSCSVEG